MADEEHQTTATATAEAPASPESAPGSSTFPDIADVLAAQDAESPAVSNRDNGVEAGEAGDGGDADTEETTSQQAVESADTQSDDSQPKSRPARARQELEQARSELATVRQELDDLKATSTRAQQEALASLGDDQRFVALHERYEAYKKVDLDPESYMDTDELAEYHRILPQRQHAAAILGIATQTIRAQDQAALSETVKDLELKPADYIGVDSATAVQRAVAATEKRVRAESADRIAELEADITSLTTKAAGYSKAIGNGGQSDSAGRSSEVAWDPQKRGSDNLEAALTDWMGQGSV